VGVVSARRTARIAACGAGLALVLGQALSSFGCEQIIEVPDRQDVRNVVCSAGVCKCADGFDHCAGDLVKTGCEVPITDDAGNCGACGHGCLGGACVDAQCEFVVMHEASNIAGPAVFADRVYYVDLDNGDLWSSPTEGEPDFQLVLAGKAEIEHFANFDVREDALYVILTKFGGPTRFLRVDPSNTVTEPFGTAAWDQHAEMSLAVTPGALFYKEASDVFRLDRSTLAKTVLTHDAWFGDLARRGDDVYYTEGTGLFVVRSTNVGASPELVFDRGEDLCRVFPLTTGFGALPCFGGPLERVDETGQLLRQIPFDPAKNIIPEVIAVTPHDETLFYSDDSVNSVRMWDGGPPPTDVAVSQPFGIGSSFAIAWHPKALYWSSKHGIVRRAFSVQPSGVTR
jgi:hypothetical protein